MVYLTLSIKLLCWTTFKLYSGITSLEVLGFTQELIDLGILELNQKEWREEFDIKFQVRFSLKIIGGSFDLLHLQLTLL